MNRKQYHIGIVLDTDILWNIHVCRYICTHVIYTRVCLHYYVLNYRLIHGSCVIFLPTPTDTSINPLENSGHNPKRRRDKTTRSVAHHGGIPNLTNDTEIRNAMLSDTHNDLFLDECPSNTLQHISREYLCTMYTPF